MLNNFSGDWKFLTDDDATLPEFNRMVWVLIENSVIHKDYLCDQCKASGHICDSIACINYPTVVQLIRRADEVWPNGLPHVRFQWGEYDEKDEDQEKWFNFNHFHFVAWRYVEENTDGI